MSLTVSEAAEKLGISPNGIRYKLKTGQLRGRYTGKGWRVYGLNGDEPVPELEKVAEGTGDPLVEIGDKLIALGRELKRAIKAHDEKVRQEAITDFATTLAETVQKGR
jgi:Bacterial regulatory protein, Fis family.